MPNQIESYPVLYNPNIAYLNNLKYIDFGLDQTLPTIDEIQTAKGVTTKDPELVESGILDELNNAVNISSEDYYDVIHPQFTEDITINNMIKESIDEFYTVRVFAQATEICDYLDGLIKLDRYPEDMFGDYKKIRQFLFSTDDMFERSRALNHLRIIAKSIIPVKVKQQRVEIIEPTLLSSSSVVEG